MRDANVNVIKTGLEVLFSGGVAVAVWLWVMFILRKHNFDSSGKRFLNKRNLTPQLLSEQIIYHNNATYRALEFYVKVMLSLIAGVVYLAAFADCKEQVKGDVLIYSVFVALIISALFCLMIFSHQRAKIERWEFGYSFWEPLCWNETWFVVTTVIIYVIYCNIIVGLVRVIV
jgi:hypothetical protein